MIHMTPHDQAKSTDARRPQDIGVGGGLATTLYNALVNGTKLVQVVALVRATARIEEGVVTSDQQTTLVHRDGKGSRKDGTSLPIFALTIGKEERVMRTEEVGDRTTLTDEAAGDVGAVSNHAASRKDKVPTDHSVANLCGAQGRTIDRAIL